MPERLLEGGGMQNRSHQGANGRLTEENYAVEGTR